jgi:hypothetical protein
MPRAEEDVDRPCRMAMRWDDIDLNHTEDPRLKRVGRYAADPRLRRHTARDHRTSGNDGFLSDLHAA